MGLINNLKRALSRTSIILSKSIAKDKIIISELEKVMLEADFGFGITTDIIDMVKNSSDKESAIEGIKSYLISILQGVEFKREFPKSKPYIRMFVGVNGVGKTTSIAKIANSDKRNGKKVILAACDTFRAAAIEQLEIWSNRLSVPVVKGIYGSDPASIAYRAAEKAIENMYDELLIDTAGRLHTNRNLMAEMEKIARVLKKIDSDFPQETLIILDASIGQNNIQQAKQFAFSVPLSGIVLAKIDGTAKGGSVFPIVRDLKIPVLYMCTGEGLDDIVMFDPVEFVESIFTV
ncbi:signal recognition particle-docking protein FtsY [candidate division TA06 bacterium]|uniref:Signal recognition particle-docking protein FtsY n=1 Tax=candidate division TA06 bacterium TaxID=2250710 RepID=A0A660SDB2_UNCT6|nr:MAG: signal recognition particle-docking protein FtsY [candidate division TA06 bacterium]